MANLFNSILDSLSNGLPGNIGRQSRETDLATRKQELEDRRRSSDADFIEHTQSMGALPVVNGMVKEPMYHPGNPEMGLPPSNGTVLRQADKSRTVKWKDADGQDIYQELPSVEQQQHKHQYEAIMQQMSPAETAYSQEQQVRKVRAETADTKAKAAGTSQAKAADLDTRGEVNDDLGKLIGLPAGTRRLPEEWDAIANRYNTVRAAGVRDAGQTDRSTATNESRERIAAGNVEGRQDVADTNVAGRQGVADTNAAARRATAGARTLTPGQKGIQDRFDRVQRDKAQKEHDTLRKDEDQAWAKAEGYKQILETPGGGALSSDPKFQDPDKPGGKPVKLDANWRKEIRARYDKAVALAKSKQEGARNIRKNLKVGEFSDGTQPPAAAPGAQPAAAPAGGDNFQHPPTAGRPQARNAKGEVIEWDGTAWKKLTKAGQ